MPALPNTHRLHLYCHASGLVSRCMVCCHRDLETAWEAVRLAKRPRVHTFLATSAIHMEHKLKMTPDQAGAC